MKKKQLVVLSTFDGISCGLVALKSLYKDYDIIYYVVEIDTNAIAISRHNHPNTIYLGDIRNVTKNMIPAQVDLLIGGSPCQNLSRAGKRNGMTTDDDIEITSYKQYMDLKKNDYKFNGQSYLFWEFVRLNHIFKPTYFLLENVKMTSKWEDIISDALKAEPIKINSARLSAQNRERYYWTNIPDVSSPEDKGIKLGDIIPGALAGCGYRGRKDENGKYPTHFTVRVDHKSNTLTTSDSNIDYIKLNDGTIRKLTVAEREILQTLPVGYTNVPGLSKTAKVKAIGNSWTIEVIKHIFSFLPF